MTIARSQKRLLRNEARLFTFLDRDGIPWNNNTGEHAIKAFAWCREVSDGQMSEGGNGRFSCAPERPSNMQVPWPQFSQISVIERSGRGSYRDRKKAKNCAFTIEMYPEGFPKWGQNPQASPIRSRFGMNIASSALKGPSRSGLIGGPAGERLNITPHCTIRNSAQSDSPP